MLWGILLGACSTRATMEEDPVTSYLDSLFSARHDAGRFDGAILIARGDSVLYKNAIGIADRSWNIPVQENTRFDIASLNKSFQAALVLLAVEEGRLSLNDTLTDLLGRYRYQGTFHPSVTLHHLLTHSSGLPDYDGVADSLSANGFRRFKRMHMSNDEYVDFISRLEPVGDPGEGFHYSNFAYHLLAIILEDTYNRHFGEILQEKIINPLGMRGTFSENDNRKIHEHVAEAYTYSEADSSWLRNDFIDLTLGRRIFSTAPDLLRWAQAMNDDRLLSDSSREIMQTNHLTGDISYGYGWVVFEQNAEYAWGDLEIDQPYLIHGGSTEGYRSMLVNVEDGECIIVFLANTGDRTQELELTKEIIKHFYQ